MFTKSTEECLEMIRKNTVLMEARVKSLEEENMVLKEEHYKDEELRKMKERLEKMQQDYFRGFPISEKEQESIRMWCKEHEEKKHGLKTSRQRMKAAGVSGGRYTYEFIPTSLGVSGSIKCDCGESFEFQEIG